MPKSISDEQMAAAEKNFAKIKKEGDKEEVSEAMQALSGLRSAYRSQEEAAGTRNGFVTVSDNESGK